MDCFFQAVPLQAQDAPALPRVHARGAPRAAGPARAWPTRCRSSARRISLRYRLICFDEFHIADVTDAMILYRLLVSLFDNRVSFVTTSNFKPDDLYPNGLQPRAHPARDRAAQREAGGDQRRRRHRLPPPHADRRQAVPHAAGPRGRRRHGRHLRPARRGARRGPAAAHRAPRDPRAPARRRRGVVRLQASCAAARAR